MKLLNINSHPGMITSDNDLTQPGLQFKKLNRSQKHGGGLGVLQRSSLNLVVCRSAVAPTHFEVLQLLCDMLGKYKLLVDALQTAAPGYYI